MLSWFIAAALILIFELFVGTIYLLVVSAASVTAPGFRVSAVEVFMACLYKLL